MTDQTRTPLTASDAELLTLWAQEALRDNRLQLGAALVRLAIEADHAQRKTRTINVPFAGHTRHEAPRPVVSLDEHDVDAEARKIVQVAATQVFQKPTVVPDGRRCVGWREKDGVSAPCEGGVYWHDERARWAHVDGALDGVHDAIVPQA